MRLSRGGGVKNVLCQISWILMGIEKNGKCRLRLFFYEITERKHDVNGIVAKWQVTLA